MGINVIIFGVDMSSSVHVDNKMNNILILGKVPTQGLDDTTSTAEAQYSRLNNIFCLSLHYNGSNSFLFVNATEIYQFKAKDSEIEKTPCVLEIIQELVQPTTWKKKKTGLDGCVCTSLLLIIDPLILVILFISIGT